MKTKMQVLAEMLDVEFGEEFTLEWNEINYRCRITETGGLFWHSKTGWHKASGDLYRAILFDAIKVFKLYHPSEGETYYLPSFDSYYKNYSDTWEGVELEVWAFNHGLVCKTREEAQELAYKLADYAKKIRS